MLVYVTLTDTLITLSDAWFQHTHFTASLLDSLVHDAEELAAPSPAASLTVFRCAASVVVGLMAQAQMDPRLHGWLSALYARFCMILDLAPRVGPTPRWNQHILQALVAFSRVLGPSCRDFVPHVIDYWLRTLPKQASYTNIASTLHALSEVL
jgi:hypothetical protein